MNDWLLLACTLTAIQWHFWPTHACPLHGLQLEATLADAAAAKALVTSERERSGVLEKARAAAVEVCGWLPCLPAAPLAGCFLSAAIEVWS